MQITEKTSYQTSDGSLFLSKKEAEEHEEKTNIKNKIKKFAKEKYFPGMTLVDLEEILEEYEEY